MPTLSNRKDKFLSMANDSKKAVTVMSALDKLRREHYGDMPVSAEDIKLVDQVMKLLFDEENNSYAESLRKKYPNIDMYKEQVMPIFRRGVILYRQALKMVGNDYRDFKFEDKFLANELARELSAPETILAPGDDFVKKLAVATVAAVKKVIKPGRGSKNVRYPEETKWQCDSIWKYCRDNQEVKNHAAGHKVSYDDVFEYAKVKLARLKPVPIKDADQFRRVLDAISDKNYRNKTRREKEKPR